MHITHVLSELVEIAIRSEDRAARRIKTLKESVAEGDRRLRMVDRGKEWRAANVPQGSIGDEVRCNGPRIFHPSTALVIEEPYLEAGINGRLIGIGERPRYLVQTESCEQVRFVGDAVVDPDRKL